MKATGLRIALVGPLPPPSGGMANQTLQLATLLRAEGATVEMIQVNRPYQPAWIGKIPVVRAMFRLPLYIADLWRAANLVDVYHVMANSGWSWHLFAAPAIWVARLRGKPVVVNYRGGEADSFLSKALFWIKLSLTRSDAIIVPSGFLRAVFEKNGIRTEVVPNVINLHRFSSADAVAPSDDTAPCILVSRNLEPIYDNATAIRAFAIVKKALPSARLIIAGSGPELQNLVNTVSELGISAAVTFTGRVNNEDMPALYRQAQVMVNPSLVDNMPNSILEALASGVPVVSTNVGGVPYVVEHDKTALLVAPQDPQEMAAAILVLLKDPAKAEQMRQAGIQSVQQYTWSKVQSRLLGVYERVVAKGRNSMVGAK
ncbi:MAG: glycosyltransferase family 1 protein [Burkholderia sp.]|nr:glycosyltransferase family 1 protein [Burkholderia sp.]